MYNMELIQLLLLSCVCVSCTVVNIPGLGSLQGSTSQSYFTKRTIYEFKGVPFAERPVRFMPPVKKAPWEGVLNATAFGRPCPQRDMDEKDRLGDLEDCLFLDVYTPMVDNASQLPVLFYIHGGAFSAGASEYLAPGFFLEYDLVIVSIQYRLGPFGFLSLGNSEIRGNAGMYDQLMALQWTYDNIQHFGGDPSSITVSGVSAGAGSASLLYISPLSQHLIKQALIFSGSAVAYWSVGADPVKDSLKIAEYAGCSPPADVVSCLKALDPLAIVQAYDNYKAAMRTQARSGVQGIVPVLDGHFLTEMPEVTMSRADFNARPLIMSVVKHEGQFLERILYQYYLKGNNLTDDYDTLKYRIQDVLLSYTDMKDISCTIGAAIKDKYFKPEELGNYTAMRAGITDFLGSSFFKGPSRKMAELNARRGGPTYLTTFNYYSQQYNTSGVTGHWLDQLMIFPLDDFPYTAEDLILVQKLTAIYFNFISTGVPSGVTWDPYSLEGGHYLIIDTNMTISSPFEEQYYIAEREGLFR